MGPCCNNLLASLRATLSEKDADLVAVASSLSSNFLLHDTPAKHRAQTSDKPIHLIVSPRSNPRERLAKLLPHCKMAKQITHDHDAAIGDFRAKLQDCTVRAACGRNYVRTGMLTDWLSDKVGLGSKTTHATRLLLAAYRDRIGPGLPISSEALSSGEARCLLVFSILLDLRLGQLVDSFQRLGIVDKRLPVDLLSLQEKISAMDLPQMEEGPKSLAERFDDTQWRFCAAGFDLRLAWEHPKNMILPIFKKEKINDKGGTASLWQVAVQEEFVGHKLRDAVRNSRFRDSRDNFGWVSSIRHKAMPLP